MAETFQWSELISNSSSSFTIAEPYFVNSVKKYEWLVIVGGILAFAMAWGIGANDVANAFATSVGAGSITLPTALVIAAIMEFGGAILLGGEVTDTVRKKIINIDTFDPNKEDGSANGPELLMVGFFIALISATIWLILATYLSLPVSTSHSIIGALLGVGLAYRGAKAVVWISSGSGFDKLKGVVGVVLSWIISPVLSAIIAVIFFLIVRTFVLRRENSFQKGLYFMPIFYGVTLTIAIFFIIYQGDNRFDISDDLGTGPAVGIAFGAGAVFAILSFFIISPLAKKAAERWEERELEKAKNPEGVTDESERKNGITNAFKKVGINLTIDEELSDDVIRMHDNVEKFDPKTERLFTWVQVFTAAVDSFAHGANDVANAIAPFASIYELHNNGGIVTVPQENKFEKDGTYTGGGRLDGTDFTKDELIPDFENFCGAVDGTDYFKCKDDPVFPYKTVFIRGADSQTFVGSYDDEGALKDDSAVVCYSGCNPRNYEAYTDKKQSVQLWILALGGGGIVLGLAMWGYRIILAIGVKLTKLTPSRGFSIEIGAAITVLIASKIGLPVSTTHCQVGATMGVGLAEGKASTVNWKQFLIVCVGWVFTLIFTGFISAILFLTVTSSPFNVRVPQGNIGASDNNLDFCPGNRLFVFNPDTNGFSGIICSGQEESTIPSDTFIRP